MHAKPKVSWCNLVWGKFLIRRHSFIAWLAIRNRMATNDRMYRWTIVNNNLCSFCNSLVENIGHLFFDCSFQGKFGIRFCKNMKSREELSPGGGKSASSQKKKIPVT